MSLPRALFLVLLVAGSRCPGAITVHFDSPTYQVQPLGTVQTQISYDADPNTPGDQPLPGGLAREALLATYNEVYVASDFSDVTLPALMNTPLNPGDQLVSGTNQTERIAAQLDPASSTGYTGTLLATLTFSNDAHPGTDPLTLALNPAATPSFLDFNTHSPLDNSITFQGATITVLPEPTTFVRSLLIFPILFRRRVSNTA